MAGLGEVDYSGASSFETALKLVAEAGITAFTDAFDDSVETVTTSINTMVTTSATSIKDCYTDFYNAGIYLVKGFAAGITANQYMASARAAAMASAAKEAAQAELDEHSPSKEFYRIGAFAGEGLIIALDDYSDKSYDAGANVANNAKRGLSDAIAKVTDAIESDIDAQPTIRPVLDLSDVEAGAKTLNDIMAMNPLLRASSNISSINSMMNNRQNGANTDDLLSAIETLSKQLSEKSGDTYNINGINYGSDSAVAEAIETLVRAAKLGRRI